MAWQDLVTCALLGTERQALEWSAGDDALGQLLSRLDADDREGALLRAAGVMTLWRRAGQLPARDRTTATAALRPGRYARLRAAGPRASRPDAARPPH